MAIAVKERLARQRMVDADTLNYPLIAR